MNWKWVTSDPICNLPCRQKEPNTTHKPVTWWDHFRVPVCNGQPIRQRKVGKRRKKIPSTISTRSPQNPRYQEPISWLDTRGISPKLTKHTQIYVLAYLVFFVFFVLLNLPSLFSYPCSYPLHVPCFSCATIHSSPSQLLDLLLFIHSLPIFAAPYYPSPACHHITPPSYTLTTYWLAYYTKHTHYLPPAIPLTSTFQYNSGNTPQYTLGLQNPADPIPLFPHTTFISHVFSATLLISICSLIIITIPQIPLFIDIIIKSFSIQYVNNWSGIETVNLLLLI
jgi:hypothetical protein